MSPTFVGEMQARALGVSGGVLSVPIERLGQVVTEVGATVSKLGIPMENLAAGLDSAAVKTEEVTDALDEIKFGSKEFVQGMMTSVFSFVNLDKEMSAYEQTMAEYRKRIEEYYERRDPLEKYPQRPPMPSSVFWGGMAEFMGLFGGTGRKIGGAIGKVLDFLGGGIFGGLFHEGGMVFGKDEEVPATLLRGEGVINRRGMGKLGKAGLERLNRGEMPAVNVTVNVAPGENWADRVFDEVQLQSGKTERYF
jgi:hypothetical protein